MSLDSGTLFWLHPILAAEQYDATETLLLVGLAQHIDTDDECYPSIEVLARFARCSYGTARRRLAQLEERGAISRSRRRRDDGNLSVYDYRLEREAFGLPARSVRDGAQPSRSKVRDDQRAPGRAMTSAHLDARAEPPSGEPPSMEVEPLALALTLADDPQLPAQPVDELEGFESFWSTYPYRRGSKADARKAWPAAVRAAGSPSVILSAVARYAADPNLPPEQFVPHGVRWLRREGWTEGPCPPRADRPGARTAPTQDRSIGTIAL